MHGMKLKIKITGPLVHDVGYRAFLLEMAEDLELMGFSARNMLEDDEQLVLALAEGDLDAMAQFRQIVEREHPPKAEVREIIITEFDGVVGGIDAFSRKFSARQLRKGISSIIRIETMQDQMLLMQGEMLKKQCDMLEKQDMTRESIEKTRHDIVDELKATKQDLAGEIRESTHSIVEEVKETRDVISEQKLSMEVRLDRVEGDIAQIKTKIGL